MATKFNAGTRVRYKGDVWDVHSVIEMSGGVSEKPMYWITRNKGRFDEDVRLVFECDLEGMWEYNGTCCCGSDKIGGLGHSTYCPKFNGHNKIYE